MKAIRVHAPGGPDALRYEDVPQPTPGAGQVVVKIEAAGVNFIDLYHRTGLYKAPLPLTLGQEAAGTVAATGPGVSDVKVGARVAYAAVQGAYAEYAVVPADRVVVLPDGVSSKQAAAVVLHGITAHCLASTTYALKPGDTCLVHAAAGGVGSLLCQIAKLRGARVIGTVSTPEKAALASEAGADEVMRRDPLKHHGGRLLAAHAVREHDDPVGGHDGVLRVRALHCSVGDAGPDLHVADPRPGRRYGPGCFLPQRERQRRLVQPGAMVKVDEVDPGSLDPDDHLPRAGRGLWHVLVAQRFGTARGVHADRLHGAARTMPPSSSRKLASSSSSRAAFVFSSRCRTVDVPGIGSMTGDRRSSQAIATCAAVDPVR